MAVTACPVIKLFSLLSFTKLCGLYIARVTLVGSQQDHIPMCSEASHEAVAYKKNMAYLRAMISFT